MRFLFVTFFNPDNIGVRSLGATLRAHGHDAHILQVKRLASAACFPPPKEIGWYVYVQGIMKTDFLMPELSAKERQLVIQAIREYNPGRRRRPDAQAGILSPLRRRCGYARGIRGKHRHAGQYPP